MKILMFILPFLAPVAVADEVAVWGGNSEGQVIAAPQPFSRIVAGGENGYALDTSGSISGWGYDGQGQVSDVPAGHCYTAVSSGRLGNVCALRADGSIAAWGDDVYNQVSETPTGSGYTAIAAGDSYYSCALRADGSIVAWGAGIQDDPQAPNISGLTAIAVTGSVVCALTLNGSIFAWDLLTGSLLGTPTGSGYTALSASDGFVGALDSNGAIVVLEITGQSLVPTDGDFVPPSGSGFTKIVIQSGGGLGLENVALALAADGSIVAWGSSSLGLITGAPSGSGFSDVAVTQWGAYALASDGSIVAWSGWSPFPFGALPVSTGFTAVTASKGHAYALGPDGSIRAWGSDDDFGLLSNTPTGSGFTAIATGGVVGVALALATDGSIAAWGDDFWGQVSGGPSESGFTAISTGNTQSYALDVAGSIVGWGDDFAGQVSQAPTGFGYIAIAAGSFFGCALGADGSITAWGGDFGGAVSGAPTEPGFTAIAASGGNGYALDANGSIAVWGSVGPLSQVPTGSGFTAIAVGDGVGYALAADGSIVAWGDDGFGQVTEAPAGSGFTAIAAGAQNGYALSNRRRFAPGDRLLGEPTAIGETMTVTFMGLEGMKLQLNFPKSDTAMKSRVTVRDDLGAVVRSWTVNHKKKGKRRRKLKRTGLHTLTVETLSGTPGPFEIQTSRKLPRAAAPSTKVMKGKAALKEVAFELLALPCATLGGTFRLKGHFTEPLMSVTRPDGTPLAVTTSVDADVLSLAPVHVTDVGTYVITIRGFGPEAKGRVKAKLDPQQPAPVNKTVLFP